MKLSTQSHPLGATSGLAVAGAGKGTSGDPPAELHLSLSEQSASESAPEDQPDREEDPQAGAEDPKTEKSPGAESKGLGCKRGSPKAGEAWQGLWVVWGPA